MSNYEKALESILEKLDCDFDTLEEEVDKLLVVERWLYSECKEPHRTKAFEWLSKFGYDEYELPPVKEE